jgi:hypothetical protein
MKVLSTHRPPLPQKISLVLISVRGGADHNANDTIGDRTRDLPTCSAVPKCIRVLCNYKKHKDVGKTLHIYIYIYNVKVKQSRYRPGVAQRVAGS